MYGSMEPAFFNRYELLEKLDVSRTGEVFKAKRKRSHPAKQ